MSSWTSKAATAVHIIQSWKRLSLADALDSLKRVTDCVLWHESFTKEQYLRISSLVNEMQAVHTQSMRQTTLPFAPAPRVNV